MRRIEIDQRIGKTEFEVQLVVTGALSNRNKEIRVLHIRITEFISLGSKVGTQRIVYTDFSALFLPMGR